MRCQEADPADLVTTQRLQAIDRLAAGVAHEFNNVLQIVSGYVTFARENLPADSPVRSDLDHALIATGRASRLASRLLQFARAEDDEAGVADVGDAVESLELLLRPIIGENIGIEVAAAEEPIEVAAGDASLRQALLNLSVNARDAMPAGGVLRLAAGVATLTGDEPMAIGTPPAGDYARVSVEDTGEGIDPSVIGQLFKPCFTTKQPGVGTGLGLAMMADFVRRANGGVQVTSRPGEGTRFELYLPLAEADSDFSYLTKELGCTPDESTVIEGAF